MKKVVKLFLVLAIVLVLPVCKVQAASSYVYTMSTSYSLPWTTVKLKANGPSTVTKWKAEWCTATLSGCKKVDANSYGNYSGTFKMFGNISARLVISAYDTKDKKWHAGTRKS